MADKRTIEEKKIAFLDMLKSSLGIVTIACRLSGTGRTMLYQYKKDDLVFASQIEEIEESAKDFVEGKLIEQILRGSITAIIFYLKAKAKDRGYR